MKKKFKLSAYEKKVLLYWKTWYITHGDNCPHPILESVWCQVEMFSATYVKEKKLWDWVDPETFNIKFTQHFFDLIDNYD